MPDNRDADINFERNSLSNQDAVGAWQFVSGASRNRIEPRDSAPNNSHLLKTQTHKRSKRRTLWLLRLAAWAVSTRPAPSSQRLDARHFWRRRGTNIKVAKVHNATSYLYFGRICQGILSVLASSNGSLKIDIYICRERECIVLGIGNSRMDNVTPRGSPHIRRVRTSQRIRSAHVCTFKRMAVCTPCYGYGKQYKACVCGAGWCDNMCPIPVDTQAKAHTLSPHCTLLCHLRELLDKLARFIWSNWLE